MSRLRAPLLAGSSEREPKKSSFEEDGDIGEDKGEDETLEKSFAEQSTIDIKTFSLYKRCQSMPSVSVLKVAV